MVMQVPSIVNYSVSNFEPYSPSDQTESRSMKKITKLEIAHRYRCKLKVTPKRVKDDSREVSAWLEALEGKNQKISLQIPFQSKCRGLLSGLVTVVSTANKGAKQIVLNSPVINKVAVVKAGDCFTFGAYSKVYKALYDADSNANGDVVVYLTLHLLSQILIGSSVVYDNVPFIMSQVTDTQAFRSTSGSTHAGFDIDLEEV